MQSLTTLEYGKLLALVARHAQTPMGKARLENLQPLISRLELDANLQAVAEMIALAQRDVNWSFSELPDPSDAIAVLRISNATLDPLSLAPLLARARVEEKRRDDEAALAAYREAVRIQPENPKSWYELGLYEFDRGDRCSAYVHLNEAYTLDPAGRQWVGGGPLDQAREWVNDPGNC